MKPLRNNHLSILSLRASVRSSMEALWLCYSSPTPQSASNLLTLLVLCLSLAAVTASLLFHWLIDLLKYDIQTALVPVGIYATAVFVLSMLIHPFRCAFTLIFPTLFTRQGRKLLLSTSVMIVVLYVLPNMAANIATLTHVVKCASEKLSQSLLSSSELINTIKDNIVRRAEERVDGSLVQTLRDFDHTTHINVSEVKGRLHVLSQRVQEDFSEVKSQVQDLKLLFSRIFAAFFVLYLFTESVVYLRSYLTSVRFDNTYITGGLRRKGAEKGIVVEEKDVKNGVNSTSFRITKRELFKCLAPAMVITLYLLMTIFLLVLDHFLYYLVRLGGPWISNMPSTNISINVNFKVGTEVSICKIFSSDCQVELFNFNRTYTALIHSDPNVCEAQSSELNPSVVTALVFLYLFSYTLLPLEVYARRLLHDPLRDRVSDIQYRLVLPDLEGLDDGNMTLMDRKSKHSTARRTGQCTCVPSLNDAHAEVSSQGCVIWCSILMGESGTRRSTLVSRLPIFRRSVRKRQDSLPSSPSSGGVGNGVHTSSPSSTNSSSSSTGKRRSLFRTPSLSFHCKRNSDPTQLSLDNRSQGSEVTFRDGSVSKTRHSFGFGGHKKKITRSQTEDLEKASTNRSVFINCISSGTNEGDDSGFLDDVSSKRSSKHKKQLLPKSLSAHQRFSKNSSNVPDQSKGQDALEDPPKTGTPGSWPGELAESSLQSPMISEDRTTAITPSDFVHVTEDSVSEVDALPVPSPAAPPENFCQAVSTSHVSFSPAKATTEKHALPDTSHTANTQCESTTAHTEPVTLQTVKELNPNTNPNPNVNPDQSEASEIEQAPELSEDSSSNPDTRERRSRHTVLIQQAGRSSGLSKLETRSSHLRKPHTVSMCSSVSPYHEVMRMERRLRSASEGAGGPRLHLNLRDPHCMDGNSLSKQRTNSSSSKLGSLDVLNNLGSSELDEDDLMLDLDLSDDQRQHHASREDSSQSLASCLNLLPSPLEASTDRTPGREPKEPTLREQRPMSLCLSRDDEPLPGLEALPFRLMQQDCTAVKTLLLRLRRTLQESVEISPASSLHSLPISPCSEKSLPFKDPGREENQFLQQQLKEKDELIVRLQAELESTRAALKSLCQKADKSTQTDFLLSEISDIFTVSRLVFCCGAKNSQRGNGRVGGCGRIFFLSTSDAPAMDERGEELHMHEHETLRLSERNAHHHSFPSAQPEMSSAFPPCPM
ncbi:hypothetical protein QQF64_032074 [Cirrhinus molitorella]|uniref:Dendritic cell-specific transmembrane protein-like domain-containing protein n=1 Tax=Cirrhinus molitorella TaxID=172907 RepID=A0ABR3MYW5_9TELE